MVSAGSILLIGLVGVLFFAFGGISGAKQIFGGLKGRASDLIPKAQAELAVTESSKEAIKEDLQIAASSINVAGTRKTAGTLTTTVRLTEFQNVLQEQIALSALSGNVQLVRGGTFILDKPTTELTKRLTGVGTAQFSTGQVAILTEAKRKEIAAKELTAQQIEDVRLLDIRRQESQFTNLKLSGAELVQRKAEQEELSKVLLTSQFGGQTFVGGKLFANPSFQTGGA